MAEVDTSSYLRPAALPAQKSILDQVGQYQTLERGNIALGQEKLKYYNDQFNIINDEISTLANDPKTTPQEVMTRLHRRLEGMNASPQVHQHMESEFANLPNTPLGKDGTGNPELSRHLDLVVKRGQAMNDRVNNMYRMPVSVNNNNAIIPSRQGLRGGPEPVADPIPLGVPPTTERTDTNEFLSDGKTPNPNYGSKGLIETRPPPVPPGMVQKPGGFPGQGVPPNRLPVQGQGGPTPVPTQRVLPTDRAPLNLTGPGKQITGVDVETGPSNFNKRFVGSGDGISTSMPPMFEEGKKQLVEDQALATQKLTAVKPAVMALRLMKDINSGPGTELYTKAVAALQAAHIIPINVNDPIAVRQEMDKYLYQYLKNRGGRSDADLTAAMQSSPNAGIQINLALRKLTETSIAQDRIEAARPNTFGSKNYSNYGEHRSKFPAQMDERAFTLDEMEPVEKQKLLGQMLKNKNTKEGQRFWNSVQAAKNSGVLQ